MNFSIQICALQIQNYFLVVEEIEGMQKKNVRLYFSFNYSHIISFNDLDNDREALKFAVAASCLMHSIPVDLPLLSVEEVKSLVEGQHQAEYKGSSVAKNKKQVKFLLAYCRK